MSPFPGTTGQRPTAVNQQTGEVVDIGEVNSRLMKLADELDRQQPELKRLLEEQQRVTLRCELVFASAVKTSQARSEDRRRAEATIHLSESRMDDSPLDLATRRAVLDMQVKAMREAMHNIRAQISGLQTLSANLRTEANLGGMRP